MRVLIGCEESGIVREAFKARGHDAWSCDLVDSRIPRFHLKCDIRRVLDLHAKDYDLLIAFPPCTHLAVSGAWRFKDKLQEQAEAIEFVRELFEDSGIPRIALENPIGVLSTKWRKPDQIVQPYNFGEDASKRTCLWLKNLPPLVPTRYVEPRIVDSKPRWANQTDSGQNRLGPSADRAMIRGTTYRGIAEAMASQWSDLNA